MKAKYILIYIYQPKKAIFICPWPSAGFW